MHFSAFKQSLLTLLTGAVLAIAPQADAQTKTTVKQAFSYENLPVLAGEGISETSRLRHALVSETDVALKHRTTEGSTFAFGIKIKAQAYASDDVDDKATVEFIGSYQVPLDTENKWQFRLQAVHAVSQSEKDRIFDRTRIGARLQFKHDKEHTTRARLRLGHRDQNEALFEGYDQREVLAEITHEWRPNADRFMVSGTIYGETRRAEKDQYSYAEVGARATLRVPLSDLTEITGRVKFYQRDFDGAFASSSPLTRSDTRMAAHIRVDRKLSQNSKGFAYIGWDSNRSNITSRSYDGAIFGAGISMVLK
ncbi:hypothetical protein Z946_3115 [Sulfitobacter noctilucicola]|uniref:DUF2860 domain-containing protein n=1 Tax=Sulfitobacter noctilucicola TaxID=1342301 RepID=A0A7W6MAT1_9RHOB|nr:hypothetical protein [Sulfitobacter noctilucicola]KIN64226.1 hypothetical protein Z946_3115 [Sulfitobacter noctilucicola]MBB4174606.1 hypothetical protein [Sulfitobacter noctilucicola]